MHGMQGTTALTRRARGCAAVLVLATAALGLSGCGLGRLDTEETCKAVLEYGESITEKEIAQLERRTKDRDLKRFFELHLKSSDIAVKLSDDEWRDLSKFREISARKCKPYTG